MNSCVCVCVPSRRLGGCYSGCYSKNHISCITYTITYFSLFFCSVAKVCIIVCKFIKCSICHLPVAIVSVMSTVIMFEQGRSCKEYIMKHTAGWGCLLWIWLNLSLYIFHSSVQLSPISYSAPAYGKKGLGKKTCLHSWYGCPRQLGSSAKVVVYALWSYIPEDSTLSLWRPQ